ncbi:hypothetical protein [Actinocorallia herbida]|uniref:hypothetical protein n=1 Tax=Actinocorallia herbida TaxID=58109 RepID=UPI001FE44083|nr:hypothetical protein [Actinocorallia herbida]
MGDPLKERDAERERLARAGPRLADDVLAAERYGQREGLDREGCGDALCREGIGYFGDDPKVGERSQGFQPP